jgi:SprT protein
VAHVIAHQRFGPRIQPHGPEWRAIMQDLGADPSRCHNYDVSGLAQRRLAYFDYQCGCMTHRLSSIRHNRITRGQRYLCRRCGEPLRRDGDV